MIFSNLLFSNQTYDFKFSSKVLIVKYLLSNFKFLRCKSRLLNSYVNLSTTMYNSVSLHVSYIFQKHLFIELVLKRSETENIYGQ